MVVNDKADSPTTKRKRGRPPKEDAGPSREAEATYRKRAETAPLVVTEGEWTETITEAVYWPGEGYGCGTRHQTRQDAEAAARSALMLGYGRRHDRNRVHIIEIRKRIIEVSISDA